MATTKKEQARQTKSVFDQDWLDSWLQSTAGEENPPSQQKTLEEIPADSDEVPA